METTYERLWVEGVDPKDGGWPGLRTGLVEEEDGILIERDVAVELRDGATVYVDVFRPKGVSELPVLLTMSPYGKHAPKTFDLFPGADVPAGSVSRHAVWEGPDPMWWCKQGYAVINADTRGSWGSEGDVIILAQLEAPDGYDTVEWAAQLPWCNGKVGMAGVSYLANIQWRVAAERPPSLAAINPWEGFTDAYREYLFHGGIAETKFNHFTQWSCRCSYGRVENLVELHRRHLLLDDFNASKSVRDLSVIDVPAYVVAGWGDQGLHTRGTIEGFRQISSADKWLEVHGRKKWQYYYRPESLRRQKAFFDAFLHDEPSRIAHWPRVRIEVRERYYVGQERGEQAWPLERTEYVPLYLDAQTCQLNRDPPMKETAANYDPQGERVVFDMRFSERTELTGYSSLRLWVETSAGDDIDLFVALQKVGVDGEFVTFPWWSMMEDGDVALGWLRASHRELDEERSTPWQPWLRHQRRLPLTPGEAVPVDVEIWPASTVFEPGESLSLLIQGRDIHRYDLGPSQEHLDTCNVGTHTIRAGGQFQSYLLVPVIPERGGSGEH